MVIFDCLAITVASWHEKDVLILDYPTPPPGLFIVYGIRLLRTVLTSWQIEENIQSTFRKHVQFTNVMKYTRCIGSNENAVFVFNSRGWEGREARQLQSHVRLFLRIVAATLSGEKKARWLGTH